MPTQISPGIAVQEFNLTTTAPAIATSVGALAGIFRWGPVAEVVLIGSENQLYDTFGPPNSNCAETWFTGAHFLSYSNALNVVRAANTTNPGANKAFLNAIGNTGAVGNIFTQVVRNNIDFNSRQTPFDANTMFVAKWPGARGNSLQVSVCDSVNGYSSAINMVANSDVAGTLTITIGSSNGTLAVNSVSANVTSANTYAANLFGQIAVGDYLVVGNNTTIGTQFLQVKTITNASNATTSLLNFTFVSPYVLKDDFTANSTVSNTVQRYWQYYNVVGTAPSWTGGAANNLVVDGQHVVVVDAHAKFTGVPGTVLEVYRNVSRATDAQTTGGQTNYYQTIINQSSKYVWAVNDRPDHNANSAPGATVLASADAAPLTMNFNSGQDGESESNATLATVAFAYDKFNQTEVINVNLVMQGKPIGGSVVSASGITVNNFQLANYLIGNLISLRQDCILCITPDDQVVLGNAGNEAYALAAWRSVIASTTYAVCDSGYQRIYDKYNQVYRFIPTNGDIAGLCAHTDSVRNPWWSPAGFNRGQLRNAVKMRFNPNKTDRDLLYPVSINPVVSFVDQGTVLYGDKTLSAQPSAFDRINVRRLFLTLEKAITISAQYSMFEFNDAFTQAAFVNLVTPYLRSIKALRGISDFYVQCDSTNNTQDVVDNNQFVASVYVKPTRSINFIQLNFIAVPTGVSFDTVVGSF